MAPAARGARGPPPPAPRRARRRPAPPRRAGAGRPPPRAPAHDPAPRLARSTLHRCLERHGTGRPPEAEGGEPKKKRFGARPVGHARTDIAGASTGEGKLRLLVAVDRTSELAFVRPVEGAGKAEAARLLRELTGAVPRRAHAVPTDDGVRSTPRQRAVRDGRRIPGRARDGRGTERRPTGANRPWANGRVGRTDRTPRGATVERRRHGSRDRLQLFVDAYNHARRLRSLRGPTPRESVHRAWTREPDRFRLDPSHLTPGPYT